MSVLSTPTYPIRSSVISIQCEWSLLQWVATVPSEKVNEDSKAWERMESQRREAWCWTDAGTWEVHLQICQTCEDAIEDRSRAWISKLRVRESNGCRSREIARGLELRCRTTVVTHVVGDASITLLGEALKVMSPAEMEREWEICTVTRVQISLTLKQVWALRYAWGVGCHGIESRHISSITWRSWSKWVRKESRQVMRIYSDCWVWYRQRHSWIRDCMDVLPYVEGHWRKVPNHRLIEQLICPV